MADDAAAGLLAELLPLIRDGLVVFRTFLDLAIQRLEELEEGRVAHVRRETYETILAVLDEEIARLEAEEPSDAIEAQVEALRSLRRVLERRARRTADEARGGPRPSGGNGSGPDQPRKRKVTID